MTSSRRLVPQPAWTGALLVIWMLLGNTLSPGWAALGLLPSLMIPPITARLWPTQPRIGRWRATARFAFWLLVDILTANFTVARLVLDPRRPITPALFLYRTELRDPFLLSALANTVSLTPGTVTVGIAAGPEHGLLIHALSLQDPVVLEARIRERYEMPLREIFQC